MGGYAVAMTGTLRPILTNDASHEHTLPSSLRIANAAAVLDGTYGAVTRLRCRPHHRLLGWYRRTGFRLRLDRRLVGLDQGGHLLPVHRRGTLHLAGVGQ